MTLKMQKYGTKKKLDLTVCGLVLSGKIADEDLSRFSSVRWNDKSCRVECDVARLDR